MSKIVSKNSFQKAILTALALTGAKTTSELMSSVKIIMGQTSYGKEIYRGETSRFDEKFYNTLSNKSFFIDKNGRTLIEVLTIGSRKKIYAITPQGIRSLAKIF